MSKTKPASAAPAKAKSNDTTKPIDGPVDTSITKSAVENPTEHPAGRQNDIPKTSATSSVTSDLPATPEPQAKKEKTPGEKSAEQHDTDAINNSPEMRAVDAGIGLVNVDGGQTRYVGVAPARDKDAKTPSGLPITTSNSTFTPLANVPFDRSLMVKDPKSGEFYYPGDGITSWDSCMHKGKRLIPDKPSAEGIEARSAEPVV